MDTIHYVRTTLSVPGAGMAIHIAELKELNSQVCEMLRLIALDPNNSIVGAAAGDAREGNIDMPPSRFHTRKPMTNSQILKRPTSIRRNSKVCGRKPRLFSQACKHDTKASPRKRRPQSNRMPLQGFT